MPGVDRDAVRHRLLGRTARPPAPARMAGHLRAVAGRALHGMDLLRFGDTGPAIWLRPAADAGGHVTGLAVRSAVPASAGRTGAPPQQRNHRRPGGGAAGRRRRPGCGDHLRRSGRHRAVHRTAAEGSHTSAGAAVRQRNRPAAARAGSVHPVRGRDGGVHHPVWRAPCLRCRAQPRHRAGAGVRVAGQAVRAVRCRRLRAASTVPRRQCRHRHPRRRDRQHAAGTGLPGDDRPRRDGRVHPATPVPRRCGGTARSVRPEDCALAVSALPAADRRARAAACTGRLAGVRRQRAARPVRGRPADCRRASVDGAAGLHRRPERGHRHDDPVLADAVDHDRQPLDGRARGTRRRWSARRRRRHVRSAAARAVLPPHRHRRGVRDGLALQPGDGWHRGAGRLRADLVQRAGAAGTCRPAFGLSPAHRAARDPGRADRRHAGLGDAGDAADGGGGTAVALRSDVGHAGGPAPVHRRGAQPTGERGGAGRGVQSGTRAHPHRRRRHPHGRAAPDGGALPSARAGAIAVLRHAARGTAGRNDGHPHRTRTDGRGRRRDGPTAGGIRAARRLPAAGSDAARRGRRSADTALQPAGDGSRAGEHEPGHQRGRCATAAGGLEPTLRIDVRVPARPAAGGQAGSGADALGLAAHAGDATDGRSARPPARLHAARHAPPVRTAVPGRHDHRNSRQPDARRRLRRHLH